MGNELNQFYKDIILALRPRQRSTTKAKALMHKAKATNFGLKVKAND